MLVIEKNVSLKAHNTFGVANKANLFVSIENENELQELLKSSEFKNHKRLVLGGGSNVLFTKDFDGLVIKINIKGIKSTVEANKIEVTAGAGVVWNDLVTYCVKNNFAGLENLTLIPGTVGAAPVQNIGAYGVEIKDVFKSCVAIEIETGQIKTFNLEDCKFGYRESVFKNQLKNKYIITSVTFNLQHQANLNTKYGAIETELKNRKITSPTIADISEVVAAIRVSKLPDPSTIGNAGSFFKNPVLNQSTFNNIAAKFPDIVNYPAGDRHVKVAAGWLIEQCGFKGMVSGETGTWKNQALVLVNHGAATGQEIYDFSTLIIHTVADKFSIELEREVNVL